VTASQRETPPKNATSLQGRINRLAKGRSAVARRLQLLVADTTIGQMLPPGVIKGGAALQIRLGEERARATSDLDAARSAEMELEEWLDALEVSLASGWAGFTGTVSPARSKTPDDVPEDYVMRRFTIRLSFKGQSWTTVSLEVTHDEVGSTEDPDVRIGQRALDVFALLGLPEPGPVALLRAHHQIAQKLHACTSVGKGTNERAHDLVDLQLMMAEEAPDLTLIRSSATRLFISRRRHAWPPTVVAQPGWDTIYARESAGVAVLRGVDDAVAWANELIARIEAAQP
jgi:hypothetical protein